MQDEHGGVITRSRVVWGWLQAIGALVGLVAVLALMRQWASVYFVFLGVAADTPTDAEIRTYTITLVVAAVAIATAVVGAFLLGHKWLLALHLVGAVIALGVVYVFAFPADRWKPDPVDNHLPSNYHPCYSGSHSEYCN